MPSAASSCHTDHPVAGLLVVGVATRDVQIHAPLATAVDFDEPEPQPRDLVRRRLFGERRFEPAP